MQAAVFVRSRYEYGDKLQFALIVLPNLYVSLRIPYNRNPRNLLTMNTVVNNLRFSELHTVTTKYTPEVIKAHYLIPPEQKAISLLKPTGYVMHHAV